MKYAALLFQVLTVCILVIVICVHFIALQYDPNGGVKSGIVYFLSSTTGLFVISIGFVLTVIGVLGVATRSVGIYREISYASIFLGGVVAIGILVGRILTLGM